MSSLRQRRIFIECLLAEIGESQACEVPPHSQQPALLPTSTVWQKQSRDLAQPQDTPTFETIKAGVHRDISDLACIARKMSESFSAVSPPLHNAKTAEKVLTFAQAKPDDTAANALPRHSSTEWLNLGVASADEGNLSFTSRASGPRTPSNELHPLRGMLRRSSQQSSGRASTHSAQTRTTATNRAKEIAAWDLQTKRSTQKTIQQFDIDQTTKLRKYPKHNMQC